VTWYGFRVFAVLFASMVLHGSSISQVVTGSVVTHTDPQRIQERVTSIVEEAARPVSIGSAQGVEASLGGMPIPGRDVQEVVQYGDRAIPALSSYLLGSSPRRERVAIRLLGAIGGPSIADPLAKVLDHSPRAGSREEAVRSLAGVPCEQSRAIMKRVSTDDSDKTVRDLAQRHLASCGK
jgi:hypothetical protein